jgi:GNAT superfamily N-acetyltransferase
VSQVIRLALAPDIEGIGSLVALYWDFEGIAGFDRTRITNLLTDLVHAPDRGQVWVAQEGAHLVGYLLAVYLFSLEHGGLMAEIDEFFVVPEKRSLEIGADLLAVATTAMAERGIDHVQLQLGVHNSRGQRFYEQHGFEPLPGYRFLHKSLLL